MAGNTMVDICGGLRKYFRRELIGKYLLNGALLDLYKIQGYIYVE